MSADQVPTDDATVVAIYANPEPAVLDRVAGHHVRGVSRTEVQRTFSLEKAQEALDAFAQGTLGKLVITAA